MQEGDALLEPIHGAGLAQPQAARGDVPTRGSFRRTLPQPDLGMRCDGTLPAQTARVNGPLLKVLQFCEGALTQRDLSPDVRSLNPALARGCGWE